MNAIEALALPSSVLPGASPVDDDHGEYDHCAAWSALRDAAAGDNFLIGDMCGVIVSYDAPGGRVSVTITV